jgi:hypothetical protein
MKRIFLYLIVALCFSLSGWQVYRFITKHQNFQFFIKQNDSINSNQQIFIDENIGDLYLWREKSYKINIENNKIYQIIENFINNQEKSDKYKKITNDNLFFKNYVCGKYIPGYSFALYKPKKIGDFTEHGYSIIIPLILNKKIFLVNYFWTKTIEDAKNEIKNLDDFEKNYKNLLPEKLLIKKNIGLCFEGIIIPTKKYYSHWILNFFSMNDLSEKNWSNLNQKDIIKYLNSLAYRENIEDSIISEYMIDTNLSNLSNFLKDYKHHFFYSIMWLISGVYLIYIIKKI